MTIMGPEPAPQAGQLWRQRAPGSTLAKQALTTCLCLLSAWALEARAATYYVKDGGTAGAKAAATGPCATTAATMSITTHNSQSFAPGDTIYVCGSIQSATNLVVPSSGAAGSPITYRGDDAASPGTFEQALVSSSVTRQIWIANKQYLDIVGLSFRSNAGAENDVNNRAAIWIEENYQPTGNINVDRCSFYQTVGGVLLRGDVKHVRVTRSRFENMVSIGVGTYKYYGRPDSAMPSFITVGGSAAEGNTFVNIGRENTPTSGSVPGQTFGTQVNDAVFSYNHVYADAPGWGAGVYLNGVQRILIERNHIHDLDAVHRRSTITVKSDYDWVNRDILIRHNRLGPSHGEGGYTKDASEISVGRCVYGAVISGNYLWNTDGGVAINWGWTLPGTDDGCIVQDVFVYANVIEGLNGGSGVTVQGHWEGNDTATNVQIFNNTIVQPSTYAVRAAHTSRFYDGLLIKNNIIERPGSEKQVGIYTHERADFLIDYNHHYWPGSTPAVHYIGSDCAPCAWDSDSRPAGYGPHDSGGDPLFVDRNAHDLTLSADSPCRDSGETIASAIPSMTIQGATYKLSPATVLHPSTDWSTSPPTVVTADQDAHGSAWEKGAYVYSEATGSPPAAPQNLRVLK